MGSFSAVALLKWRTGRVTGTQRGCLLLHQIAGVLYTPSRTLSASIVVDLCKYRRTVEPGNLREWEGNGVCHLTNAIHPACS
jgi:hypothetical protein